MNNNNELLKRIEEVDRDLLLKKGQRDNSISLIKSKQEEADKNDQLIIDYENAISYLTDTAKKARDNTIKSIETLATIAVQAVYDEPLEIKLQYRDKSKTDSSDKIVLQLVRQTPEGEITTGLQDEVGGGLIETISFALRMACIKWIGYKGPIILDEAYKSLSNDEKIEKIAFFLKELNESVGNQIIFSTHKQDVFGPIASKEFSVTQKNSVSKVVEC